MTLASPSPLSPASPPAPPSAPRRRRRPPFIAVFAAATIGGFIAMGLVVWWLTLAVARPFKGYPDKEVFVEVPSGAGVGAIARRLEAAGVVERAWVFRAAVWQRGAARTLKAGEYRFDRPLSPVQVVDMLVRGQVYLRAITFPEGLTVAEMAEIFAAQGFGSAADFVQAAGNAALVGDLDPAAADLEGYLFPDTYWLPRRAAAPDLVALMIRRFRDVTGAHGASGGALGERARRAGRTVREVVTLASLVEKETSRDEERAIVAGVYANRLRLGMGLQCDPTVIYALKRLGRWTGNLTRGDLQLDSPYNTYRYAGLPPGPIAAPGRASLEAALAPGEVPYLYFVSRNDGSHVFATTLEEHNRNVRRFQIQYFRDLRAREREQARTAGASRPEGR
jgi:UPF0755 protein